MQAHFSRKHTQSCTHKKRMHIMHPHFSRLRNTQSRPGLKMGEICWRYRCKSPNGFDDIRPKFGPNIKSCVISQNHTTHIFFKNTTHSTIYAKCTNITTHIFCTTHRYRTKCTTTTCTARKKRSDNCARANICANCCETTTTLCINRCTSCVKCANITAKTGGNC